MKKFFFMFMTVFFVQAVARAQASSIVCAEHRDRMESHYVNLAKDDIYKYITMNPSAADTVEGIQRYWILWDAPYLETGIYGRYYTLSALECLRDHNIMETRDFAGRELWRRKRNSGE